jgi:hypothetical protein
MSSQSATVFLGPIWILACTVDSQTETAPDALAPTEWSVDGCEMDAASFANVEAWRTEIATVIRVRWSSAHEESGSIIFELDDELEQTPWESVPHTEHEALILGVPPYTDLNFVLVGGSEEDPRCSSGWSIETGGIPAALPELLMESSTAEDLDGFLAAPAITTGQSFLSLIDSKGRYVWAHRHEELVWRMRMGMDGESVLFNHNAKSADLPGPIYRVSMDGSPLETVEINGAHRDFVELPDGSIATLVWELRELTDSEGELRTILGDSLVEQAPNGDEHTVWSVWDAHSPALEQEMTPGLYPDNPDAEEWTHANALTYVAEDDSYLVSLDAWNSIVKIDRSTGNELWILTGGSGGVFSEGDLGLISNAHSVRPTEDGTLLVFNRNDFANGECAEAVELELDEKGAAAWKRWSYTSEDCQVVTYLGNAIPIPGGDRLVIFSTSGRVDRVDAQGQTLWQLRADLGFGFALSDFTSSLYPSTED